MDLTKHYTHYRIEPHLRPFVDDVCKRFVCSWNTYHDHPPGQGLDSTSIDFWAPAGRGSPIGEHKGDQVVAWILGQHVIKPVRWLVWWNWIWDPAGGWQPYSGWQGRHRDHVHVTFR